jgi:hypothetical protein
MSSETMEHRVSRLPAASGSKQPTLHIGTNVHIARSPEGAIQIILSDCEPPTEIISLKRATLSQNIDFDGEDGDELTHCVVLEFDTGVDSFAVSKIAEHLLTGPPKSRTGDDLIHTLEVFRGLVENDTSAWTFKRMLGLWGELSILLRLLTIAGDEDEQLVCVSAWQSTGVHCQDFVFRMASAAFDVKTTARMQRMHELSSVDQVATREEEESSLVSIVVRPVGPKEGLTVMNLISRIEGVLSGPAATLFSQCVQKLKLDVDVCGAHHLRERHNRPVRMYEASGVPGVSQFTPLPEGVPCLSWPVVLSERGMAGANIDSKLEEWIAVSVEAGEDE